MKPEACNETELSLGSSVPTKNKSSSTENCINPELLTPQPQASGYTYLSFLEKGVSPITIDTGMPINVTIVGGTRADFRCFKPQAYDENRYDDYQSLSDLLESNTVPGMMKNQGI